MYAKSGAKQVFFGVLIFFDIKKQGTTFVHDPVKFPYTVEYIELSLVSCVEL